jgi:stage IV sporulation protein FB
VMCAGPLAGFWLFGIAFTAAWLYNSDLAANVLWSVLSLDWFRLGWPIWVEQLVADLFWINLMWGFVNLLPVWPLDGGQISRELCQGYLSPNGLRVSLIISITCAALFAGYSVVGMLMKQSLLPLIPQGGLFGALFFAFLAFGSWQVLQQTPTTGGRYRLDDEGYEKAPWERDADWWKRG